MSKLRIFVMMRKVAEIRILSKVNDQNSDELYDNLL